MSRGHGRVQRAVLAAVLASPYGYTVRGLAGLVYEAHPPTEAGLVAVRRAVRALLREGVVVETIRFDGERLIVRAREPARPRAGRARPRVDRSASTLLVCHACDLQWHNSEGAHPQCWRCDRPGLPVVVPAYDR